MNSNKSNLEIEAIENHILALSTEIRESNNNINKTRLYIAMEKRQKLATDFQ